MSSKDRYVEHLACENTRSTGTSTDDCGTCAKDTCIRSLGTTQTKFHDRITLCSIANAGCFGSNEALVIDDIQDCCLYKLSFHDRCYNFDKRFSWEDNCSLRNCIDITCETEVA